MNVVRTGLNNYKLRLVGNYPVLNNFDRTRSIIVGKEEIHVGKNIVQHEMSFKHVTYS